MNNEPSKARQQWVGLGALAALVIAVVVVVVVVRGGNDNSAQVSEQQRTALCALRDSENKPLVDPDSSSTREELSGKIRDRAAALSTAAEATGGDAADALNASAAAMTKVADAIAADSTGKSLADVVAGLAADKTFVESSATLQKILNDKCS